MDISNASNQMFLANALRKGSDCEYFDHCVIITFDQSEMFTPGHCKHPNCQQCIEHFKGDNNTEIVTIPLYGYMVNVIVPPSS